MRSKKHNVLIIDDHPLIIDGYKRALEFIANKKTHDFSVKEAHNCDEALVLMKKHGKKPFAIIFLDMRLPPSQDGEVLSGEDLGLKIRELFPEAKIIISTTHNNPYKINNILKSLNPDAFLIKGDLTPSELTEAISSVLIAKPYYTKTVLELMRKNMSSSILIDEVDRKLLYELSIGTMMKDLPDMLNFSLAALEKRKRSLKQLFNVEGKHDKELFKAAKDNGFI